MPWQTFQATFRGLPFQVRSFRDEDIGREISKKTIAASDTYAIEDVRILQDRFSVDGLLTGADSQQDWERLRAAFQQRGQGSFQHPYIVEPIDVHVINSRLDVSASNENTILFSVTFLKAGIPLFENQARSPIQDFRNITNQLRNVSANYLGNNLLFRGITDYARNGTNNEISRFNKFLNGVLNSARFTESLVQGTNNISYANTISRFRGVVSQVPFLNTATEVYNSVVNTMGLLTSVSTDNKAYISGITEYLSEEPVTIVENTPNAKNFNNNSKVTNTAVKLLILAEVAQLMPEIEFESFDGAIEFRDDLIRDVFEIENLDNDSNIATTEFITVLDTHVPVENEDLPNLTIVENVRGQNLVDILYQQIGNVDTLDAVIRRNSILNPLVLEVDEIKILEPV